MREVQTMTDVLRAHWSASTHTDSKPFVDKCDGCGEVIFSWDDPTVRDGHEHLASHQANALAAAGWVRPPVEYHYGERFLETGMTYHSSVTEEEARRFVASMNEVGVNMEVVRRTYTPVTFGPWETVA